jgi:hypothetical protein
VDGGEQAAGRTSGHDPALGQPPSAWPADVLEEIDLAEVLALGSEGTERVEWSTLVEDRSHLCPECGLVDGPRHARKCLAHPKPPSRWWIAFACFVLPMPMMLIVGPGALLLFAPLFALSWYILSR